MVLIDVVLIFLSYTFVNVLCILLTVLQCQAAVIVERNVESSESKIKTSKGPVIIYGGGGTKEKCFSW
jgi:hypothetical protein